MAPGLKMFGLSFTTCVPNFMLSSQSAQSCLQTATVSCTTRDRVGKRRGEMGREGGREEERRKGKKGEWGRDGERLGKVERGGRIEMRRDGE